jgi:FtsH-binding integral membrane protein
MNNTNAYSFTQSQGHYPVQVAAGSGAYSDQVKRVLRNTYALLAMTLLFSAGVAVATLTL